MNLRHKLLLWRLKWMNFSRNNSKIKHFKLDEDKVRFEKGANDPEKLERLLTLFRECNLVYYIKQANDWSPTPFYNMAIGNGWDVQLNIFCKQAEKKA